MREKGEGRGQILGPYRPWQDSGFHSENTEKPQEGLGQESDMI